MSVACRSLLLILATTAPLMPAVAAGQSASQSQPVTVGWENGFVIQSAEGDHRLQFGAVLQADGRFSLDDPAPITDTFLLRKARPVFSGRVARYFDFKLMPELAGGSATVLDAYFDVRISPRFRLRSGKDKTPVGYELLLGDTYLVFVERSVVSLLVPNRDVGFQVQGEAAGGRLLYSGGIFNGNVLDGASNTTDTDTNEGKDLAGRIVVLPFRPRLNLGFHLGGSTGNQTGALPTFRTSVGQTLFAFAGTTADGRRSRVSPAVFLYHKNFGGFLEFARTGHDVVHSGVSRHLANTAWSFTVTYVVTGEPTSERAVTPRSPFDPAAGNWGAVQVAARFGEISIDRDTVAFGLAAAGASREARQLTFGINWYLNNFVRVYGTYERFTFGRHLRPDENSIIFRAQLAL